MLVMNPGQNVFTSNVLLYIKIDLDIDKETQKYLYYQMKQRKHKEKTNPNLFAYPILLKIFQLLVYLFYEILPALLHQQTYDEHVETIFLPFLDEMHVI